MSTTPIRLSIVSQLTAACLLVGSTAPAVTANRFCQERVTTP